MAITLPAELEARLKQKVEDGLYSSMEQVIEEALRALDERDRQRQERLAELRREIALGLEQLDRGGAKLFDEEAVERIIARSQQFRT